MITKNGLLPTDPKAIQLWYNPTALFFADKCLQEVESEKLEELSKILGVLWTREDVEEKNEGASTQTPDRIFIPLANIVKPEIRDSIKKMFGSSQGIEPPGWVKDTEMVNLGELDRSKDEFMQFVRQFVAPKVPMAPKGS